MLIIPVRIPTMIAHDPRQLCPPQGMPVSAGLSALLHCELALDLRLPGAAAPWTTLHMPVSCSQMRCFDISEACTLTGAHSTNLTAAYAPVVRMDMHGALQTNFL